MTLERFGELADAYGGDVSRWPLATREPAAELMALHPGDTAAMLEVATELDWRLSQWRAPAPSAAVQSVVLSTAPATASSRGSGAWIWRTGLGAGLMAAGAAGLMAGVVVSGAVAPASDLEIIAVAATPFEDLVAAIEDEV